MPFWDSSFLILFAVVLENGVVERFDDSGVLRRLGELGVVRSQFGADGEAALFFRAPSSIPVGGIDHDAIDHETPIGDLRFEKAADLAVEALDDGGAGEILDGDVEFVLLALHADLGAGGEFSFELLQIGGTERVVERDDFDEALALDSVEIGIRLGAGNADVLARQSHSFVVLDGEVASAPPNKSPVAFSEAFSCAAYWILRVKIQTLKWNCVRLRKLTGTVGTGRRKKPP